jgi:hypothetical protein
MTFTVSENWTIKQLLFRPFDVLPMRTSLILGLVIMALTACICAIWNVHLDGVLDIHTGSPSNIGIALTESAINLFCMVLCVYVAGFLIDGKHVSLIDILSTQALARALFLPNTILILVMTKVPGFQGLLDTFASKRVPDPPGNLELVALLSLVFAALALLIWTVVLMYRAYCTTCNIRGVHAVVSFIGILVAAEVLSKVIMTGLF